FGPACVVLAEGGSVHLLSTWDEGVPAEIAHDELFGLSWNPANIVGSLQRIDALGRARRIGTDSLSPGFDGLIAGVATGAEVVDPGAGFAGYEGGVGRTRAAGPPPAGAGALAERATAALDALLAACRPGATGRDIKEAWAATGEPMPDAPIAHGLGLGMEPP